MKLLKLLAVAALTIPAVSYAACPRSLSGTYGGFIFNDSFRTDSTYNDKDTGLISLTFSSAGVRLNEGYSKSSEETLGESFGSPANAPFSFDNKTCFGGFSTDDTEVGGQTRIDNWKFIVLESGAVIKGILFSQTGAGNANERDVRSFLLRKL